MRGAIDIPLGQLRARVHERDTVVKLRSCATPAPAAPARTGIAIAAVPFGLATGLSLETLGGGGSVLAVPVLVYVLGQRLHQATTASLVIVTPGAAVAGLSHAREGRVCWRHATTWRKAHEDATRAVTIPGRPSCPPLRLAQTLPPDSWWAR